MCLNGVWCTELDQDPVAWSTDAPLMPPRWFVEELALFAAAVRAAAEGDIAAAMQALLRVRSDDLRRWYFEHGRWSGTRRFERLGSRPATSNGPLKTERMPSAALAKIILSRDGHRCRYCGTGVVHKQILFDFGDAIGSNAFRASTDSGRHGGLCAFRANFDHVVPASLGGDSGLDNVVTCCWSCNYGKDRFTLEQIGLTNPFERDPLTTDWDGLSSAAGQLKGLARLRRPTRLASPM